MATLGSREEKGDAYQSEGHGRRIGGWCADLGGQVAARNAYEGGVMTLYYWLQLRLAELCDRFGWTNFPPGGSYE